MNGETKMKKAVAIIAALAAGVWALTARAATWTDPATGITWTYTVSSGWASMGGGSYNTSPAVSTTTTGALTIPSTINGYPVSSIGDYAFDRCSGLKSVTIPDCVTSIGFFAFSRCSGLMSISVGSGNVNYKSVNGLLFSKDGKTLMQGVNGDVNIPDGVTSIGYGAFSGCSSLTSVTIPNSVTSIGPSAFSGCSGLTSVTIPDSVTSIGINAFYNCSGLTSVTIPGSVASIGAWAFYGCSGLTSVTIPDSVTSIGDDAFSNCLLVFSGEPPSWAAQFSESCCFSYSLEYEAQWKPFLKKSSIVKVTSSKIRDSDPTILDTRFMVMKSGPIETPPTVKIRALAFEDGERSFAKVVRPETFVDGTAPANWDAVEANVEHTLSWKVSSDWATRLAKVKFEVLACDGDLLPLTTRTIPASTNYGKMQVAYNVVTKNQVQDALFWLYADKTDGLRLSSGILSSEIGTLLKEGPAVNRWVWISAIGVRYVYEKMGYIAVYIVNDELDYSNQIYDPIIRDYIEEETRIGYFNQNSNSYWRRNSYIEREKYWLYAYKIVEE